MDKKVIRIGSIGLGGIWSGVHGPGIARSADLQLTAICDIDVQKLQEMGEKYGIDEAHRFTKYEDLIRCSDVDAVDICTPNDLHYEMAMAAVAVGKPYTIEKPITLTSEQADTLAKATQEKGIKHMVCFSYRFKAAARYARELIRLLGTDRVMFGTDYPVKLHGEEIERLLAVGLEEHELEDIFYNNAKRFLKL